MTETYGYVKRVPDLDAAAAKARITEALKAEGFGVLSEIDVQATLRAKLGEDIGPYLILGACNPQLARKALASERGIGLLLPCNVCVWQDAQGVTVAIAKPEAMFRVVENPALAALAQEADERLRRALDTLGS
jgi:uncharacterized protein (DUF302 family)